jgi:hypothetical protein
MGQAGALIVDTRSTPELAAVAGATRIDLPEAPPHLGGEPEPDLATALRRHPGVTRLHILGDGLEPRDREAAKGLALDFKALPLRGLTELYPPKKVAQGATFQVAGRTEGAKGGSAELLDPAGRLVDTEAINAVGRFVLSGAARDIGPALFAVRVRDRQHAMIEAADVPVWVGADPGPNVLLLAGAPGPEVKQLRRWALAAGVALQASVDAGDGLELGEARPHLDAPALDRVDLVVVDERSWSNLSAGERAALIAAARGGMGLLLRVTGPLPASVRDQWNALGLPLESGEETAVVTLSPALAQPPASSAAPANALPELTRRVVDVPVTGSAILAQDVSSAVLGRWRTVGRGRVGVWAVTDSSGLVTAGYGERYGELWSTLFATLARASLPEAPSSDTSSTDIFRTGERVSICGMGQGAEVLQPDGGAVRLYVDPASGPDECAGYWPAGAGWRLVRDTSVKSAERQDRPLYVYPADALPNLRALELRDGTLTLAGASPAATRRGTQARSSGPAWPWLSMLIVIGGSVWWFERRQRTFGVID